MKRSAHILLVIILFPVFAYFLIFGRALKQNENHVGILMALPKVIITQKAVRIGAGKYLATNNAAFIQEMNNQGYIYIEQMGAGYVFIKDGKRHIVISRMYSSHFMLFTHPIENN